MKFIYNLSIHFVYFLLKIIAFFNKKIHLFIEGRKESFNKLSILTEKDKVIWFHTASLGEFEQGRPILEALKIQYPNHKIVVTFFSPSGYEIRKKYTQAAIVCYLPFDTQKNMKRFVKILHPEIAIIVKYEFWPNLLDQLKQQKINTILVSGIFRENQLFFKKYGGFMRKKLTAFNHFFVQNKTSKALLNSANFTNVTVSGDTRFDRVYTILQQDNSLDFIKDFTNNTYTVIAGSTWKEDEELLVHYINEHASENEKFIIAPHTIHPEKIKELKASIAKKTVLYSEKNKLSLHDFQVFIVYTIGILTKIYSYADVAYVGGGLATGLHNILEPATFGVPVIFGGNKYQKFKEACDLLQKGGASIVTDKKDLSDTLTTLKNNKVLRLSMGETNIQYIKHNIGATHKILDYIKDNL